MNRPTRAFSWATALLAAGFGFAQASLAAVTATDQLEEVVVTAQKRETNLQKVADSIQVKQGEEIRETGKQRLDEIMAGTVGIQAQDNRLGLTFFVRGVDSSAGNPGVSLISPVAIVVDGSSESRSEVVRGDTLDLSRVEIMRGPQSTTLGANSLSGAVSLVTNQPALNKYEAMGSVETGSYSKQAFQGVLNLPLGDTTAIRAAYSSDKRDGYISSGAGNSDLTTARIKFRWQATDDLNTVLTVQKQKIGGNGTNQNQLLAFGYWKAVSPADAGIVNLTYAGCGSNNPAVTIMGCPATFYTLTGAGPSFRDRPDAWNDGYPANSFVNSPYLETTVTKVSEQVDWNTSIGTLTVLPSFEYAELHDRENPMGSSYMESHEQEGTTNVDIHLNSREGGTLQWIAGAYYSRDNTYNAWTEFATYPGAVGGPPSGCDPVTFPTNQTCFKWQDQPAQIRTNKSVYANLDYLVTDKLHLIGGARYFSDTAEQSQQSTIDGVANAPDATQAATAAINSASYSWKHTTWRAGLQYEPAPRTMLYLTYSTGYNPGRFATAAPDGPPGPLFSAGAASTLKQYAAGWKAQWLENKVQLNGEFFFTTYFNRPIQGTINTYYGGADSSNCIPPFPPPPTALSVAAGGGGYCLIVNQDAATDPKLVSKGLDMDGAWLITPNDRLSLTFEYLKSEYQAPPDFGGADYSVAGLQALNPALPLAAAQALSQSFGGTLASFVGSTPQNSPKTSATIDFAHTFTLPGGSRLVPRVAAVYKSPYWSFGGAPGANVSEIIHDSGNSRDLAWQQAYTTWDFYLNWSSADAKYSLTGYGKNLGNEVVLQNYTYPFVSIGTPRTYGLILNAHF